MKAVRFLAAVLFLVCVDLPAARGQERVPFTTVLIGMESGTRTFTHIVIRSPLEWETAWQRHRAGAPHGTGHPPAVDFSTDMVIAVFAGEVPFGTRVVISGITPEEGRLVVHVRFIPPFVQRPLVPVEVSTPFHIVRLLRSPLLIVFRREADAPGK